MRIAELRIKNFKRFGTSFVVRFTAGLNIIVGDNEVGKSTILEAVNLVLTGTYGGRHLRNELSQSLFNNAAVGAYIASFEPGATPLSPPEILIEAHFEGDDLAVFEGDGNAAKKKGCGLSLRIALAEKYQEEYDAFVKLGAPKSLPIGSE